jgi:hypothetical protein
MKNKVFIGRMRFWAKNEGKNERKSAGNCQKRTRFDQKMTKVSRFWALFIGHREGRITGYGVRVHCS